MFKRIIIAIDLSPASYAVVECVKDFKVLGVEEIILFHAWGINNVDPNIIKQTLEPKITEIQKTIQDQGFITTYELVPGLPSEELKQVAIKKNASLIIIGSHGAGETTHPLFSLGSVASEILQSHEKPLLIVRINVEDLKNERHFIYNSDDVKRNILFATDFSEISLNALDYLASFVAVGSKHITILHVKPPVKGVNVLTESLEHMNRHEIQRLENFKLLLSSKGICHVETIIKYGNPADQIIAEAKNNYSLVVMGSQGKGFFSNIFLGSVSQNVAKHSHFNLLLIPSKTRVTDSN